MEAEGELRREKEAEKTGKDSKSPGDRAAGRPGSRSALHGITFSQAAIMTVEGPCREQGKVKNH